MQVGRVEQTEAVLKRPGSWHEVMGKIFSCRVGKRRLTLADNRRVYDGGEKYLNGSAFCAFVLPHLPSWLVGWEDLADGLLWLARSQQHACMLGRSLLCAKCITAARFCAPRRLAHCPCESRARQSNPCRESLRDAPVLTCVACERPLPSARVPCIWPRGLALHRRRGGRGFRLCGRAPSDSPAAVREADAWGLPAAADEEATTSALWRRLCGTKSSSSAGQQQTACACSGGAVAAERCARAQTGVRTLGQLGLCPFPPDQREECHPHHTLFLPPCPHPSASLFAIIGGQSDAQLQKCAAEAGAQVVAEAAGSRKGSLTLRFECRERRNLFVETPRPGGKFVAHVHGRLLRCSAFPSELERPDREALVHAVLPAGAGVRSVRHVDDHVVEVALSSPAEACSLAQSIPWPCAVSVYAATGIVLHAWEPGMTAERRETLARVLLPYIRVWYHISAQEAAQLLPAIPVTTTCMVGQATCATMASHVAMTAVAPAAWRRPALEPIAQALRWLRLASRAELARQTDPLTSADLTYLIGSVSRSLGPAPALALSNDLERCSAVATSLAEPTRAHPTPSREHLRLIREGHRVLEARLQSAPYHGWRAPQMARRVCTEPLHDLFLLQAVGVRACHCERCSAY